MFDQITPVSQVRKEAKGTAGHGTDCQWLIVIPKKSDDKGEGAAKAPHFVFHGDKSWNERTNTALKIGITSNARLIRLRTRNE